MELWRAVKTWHTDRSLDDLQYYQGNGPSWVLSLVNKRVLKGLGRKRKDDLLALERKAA